MRREEEKNYQTSNNSSEYDHKDALNSKLRSENDALKKEILNLNSKLDAINE